MKRITTFIAGLLIAAVSVAAPNATFTADTTTIIPESGRGFHFQSGSLDDLQRHRHPELDGRCGPACRRRSADADARAAAREHRF